MVAGVLMASFGTAWVFAFNAVLSLASAAAIARWRPSPQKKDLPVERFFGAMRVGIQYAVQSPSLRAVLWHSFAFSLQTTALLALLPLIARSLGGGEITYTLLMASMSIGAIGSAAWMPRWRRLASARSIVCVGAALYAASSIGAAYAPNTAVALVMIIPAGAAWMVVSNVLATSAQFALQDWVRARGMSLYLMSVMGGSAAGAASWGAVARYAGVSGSLVVASILGLALLWAFRRQQFSDRPAPDLEPLAANVEWLSREPAEHTPGPVMVTIEYLVDTADHAEFAEIMKHSRRFRLRGGAISWGLLRGADDSRRYIEYFVDSNWIEHARRHQRLTEGDAKLRARRLELHRGSSPPVVTRYVMPLHTA